MILETIDECDSGAYACICLGIFIYKLLVENKEYALVEIITLDKAFVMFMSQVDT